MNVIASYRPKGFLDHLFNFGVFPTLLTHRWELDHSKKWKLHTQEDNPIIKNNSNNTVIRLPLIRTFWGNLNRFAEKFYVLRQISIITRWVLGILDPGPDSLDSYLIYKKYLFDHLKDHKYDIVMGIFSPHHHLKLCYEINRKFNIPYILDFRDLWDNKAVDAHYSPKGSNKFHMHFVEKYWSKWLSKAVFFTTLSKPWVDKIKELTKTSGHIIMHGYDKDMESMQSQNLHNKNEFIILYVGSLYENQNVDKFLEGYKEFLNPENIRYCRLVFLGTEKKIINNQRCYYKNIRERTQKVIGTNNIEFLPKVSRNEVLDWYKKAAILLHISYDYEYGRLGGKFFEYVGTGKPIFVQSNGNCLISEMLDKYRLGFVSKSGNETAIVLFELYQNWQNNSLINTVNRNNVGKFSRSYQTNELSKLIFNKIRIKR